MQKSDNIALLATALVQAQPQVKTALMDSVNPFFKSKYADLGAVWDAVQDALKNHDLTVTQFPDAIGQEPALTTMLIHASGEWLSGTYPLMVTDKESTPQGYGSALTYARRYGLSAVMGVIADTDDDGNAATRAPKPPTAKPETVAPPASDAHAKEAREWALWAIPRIKLMDKPKLDAFEAKYTKEIAELEGLDKKTHAELKKAIDDRLEELF